MGVVETHGKCLYSLTVASGAAQAVGQLELPICTERATTESLPYTKQLHDQ